MPERWFVLTVHVGEGADRAVLADALLGLGAPAVEEREEALVTHLRPPEDPERFARHARERLRALEPDVRVEWSWQRHGDWEETWKRGLEPRRVTDRIVVSPTWRDPGAGPNDVVVRIDPGVAFGTAEHATTRGALRLLESALEPGERLLDMGTGTGILAITAARLGARRVLALDLDPFACEAARENVRRNGVADRVAVREARVDAETLDALAPVDGVIANIDAPTLRTMLPAFREVLRSGGWLVVSGVEEAESVAFVRHAAREGFTLGVGAVEDEWWCGSLLLSAGDAAGPRALREGGGASERASWESRRRPSG